MQDHRLQLNLAKTEGIFPANQYIHHNTDIKTGTLSLALTKAVQKLGIANDDQLTFFKIMSPESPVRAVLPYST